MKALNTVSVFDLNVNDKILNTETQRTGVVVDIRETAYEWVDAFVYWPDTDTEEILEMYDKNLYLVK